MKWSDGQPATSEDACFSCQLGLDAITAGKSLGAGYLEPTMQDAGVTKIDLPGRLDDGPRRPTTRPTASLQVSLPIIPKHIWGKETYKTIGDAKFDAPLVGTGPYTAAEWQTGQYVRLERNPNYWGTQAFQDEVDIIIYKNPDTMVQALKAGDLDYAHGPNAEQLNQLKTDPNIQTVAGTRNGWTQLAFNDYGADTGKTIPGGGPSTKALLDPAFRDALGYAVDHKALVDRVLGGYGDVGTTIVPPVLTQWHVEPTTPRKFDIELAKQKLDAAGYQLDANGKRLDKEGKPINLRMFMPDSRCELSEGGAVHRRLVRPARDQGRPPRSRARRSSASASCRQKPATRSTRPTTTSSCGAGAARSIPTACSRSSDCEEIGTSSDSQYCNPAYDQMYADQLKAPTAEARKAILSQMQNADLRQGRLRHPLLRREHRRLSDRPVRGLDQAARVERHAVLHLQHPRLHEAHRCQGGADPGAVRGRGERRPRASRGPARQAASQPSAAPSAAPAGSASDSGSSTPLLAGAVAVVAIVVVGFVWFSRRRSAAAAADEDE